MAVAGLLESGVRLVLQQVLLALERGAAADADRLETVLAAYGLPVRIPAGLAPDALLARMRLDKKNLAGRLRLVLWRGLGQAEVVPDADEARVLAILSA